MDLGGKIVDRFRIPRQIGTTEPMGEEIRASSVIDGRGIEDQIRFLLRMGLEYRRCQLGQGHHAPTAHMSAPLHTEAKKPPTRSRTSSHVETPRRIA
jgi:hypothetical protein